MTCPAKGSRTEITIIEETTYGVTPAVVAGDTQVVPYVSNGINLTKDMFEDPSINADRQKRFLRHGNKNVAGDMAVAYSHQSYDLFLESLFQNNWADDVLKFGDAPQSMSIQVWHKDKDLLFLYSGLRTNTFNIEVNTSGVVTSTFGMIGKDVTTPANELDASPTAAPNKEPFTHIGGTFKEGGTTSAVLTGISLTVDNQMTADMALGSDTAICVSSSMVSVTGTVTAYFVSHALYTKFLNEVDSSLEFTLSDGNANTHNFKMNKVVFTSADVPVSDGGSVTVTLGFEALNDGTNGALVITRS